MPTLKPLQFSIDIAAPAETIARCMTEPESYKQWTSEFAEGSRYEGSWKQGERIHFLSPEGSGMLAEIAEHRPNEFISIRHLGFINKGVPDTESEAARAFAPAYENYTFQPRDGGTKLVIDVEVPDDYVDYMSETWPKALAKLKGLCEAGGSAG